MNGKTSWVSSGNVSALWYDASSADWLIGTLEYLGTNTGGIGSEGNHGRSSCPYNLPQNAWKYGANQAWITADDNDVNIECLAGNRMFD